MESTTYFKNIKIAPKKLRMIMPAIRKLGPLRALDVLLYTPKKPAKIFYKAIKSALSNAQSTLKVNQDLLQFVTLSVDAGQSLKRYNAGSRGSSMPFKKRYSHIKIVLGVKSSVVENKVETKVVKTVKKARVSKVAVKK